MTGKIIMNYSWTNENQCNPRKEDQQMLKEKALERIINMIGVDYSSGELVEETEDHYYTGWWSIKYKEKYK